MAKTLILRTQKEQDKRNSDMWKLSIFTIILVVTGGLMFKFDILKNMRVLNYIWWIFLGLAGIIYIYIKFFMKNKK